jgi:hypothetical protein
VDGRDYIALDERANGSRIVIAGTSWGSLEHFFRRAFIAGQEGDPRPRLLPLDV